jgi:hypothetical protein
MNIFLRLVTVCVLVVPICMELRTAAERGMEAKVAEAGTVTQENTTCFRNEAHRSLFERLQSRPTTHS